MAGAGGALRGGLRALRGGFRAWAGRPGAAGGEEAPRPAEARGRGSDSGGGGTAVGGAGPWFATGGARGAREGLPSGGALPLGAALGRALAARALDAVEPPSGCLAVTVKFRACGTGPPGGSEFLVVCVGIWSEGLRGGCFHTLQHARADAGDAAILQRRDFMLPAHHVRAARRDLCGRKARLAVAFLRPIESLVLPGMGGWGDGCDLLELWDIEVSWAALSGRREAYRPAAQRQAEVQLLADSIVRGVAAENADLRARLEQLSSEPLDGEDPLLPSAAVSTFPTDDGPGSGNGDGLSYIAAAVQDLEAEVRAAEAATPSLALLRARAVAAQLARAARAEDAWGRAPRQSALEAAAECEHENRAKVRAKRDAIRGHVLNALANVATEADFLALRAKLSDHTDEISHQINRFEAMARVLEGASETEGASIATAEHFRGLRLAMSARLERLEADVSEAAAAAAAAAEVGDKMSSDGARPRAWEAQFQTLEDCRMTVAALQGEIACLCSLTPSEPEEGVDRLSDLAGSGALQPEVEAAVDAQIDTIRVESSLLVLRDEAESLVLRLDACGVSPEAEQQLRGLQERVHHLQERVQTLLESGSMALSFSATPVTTPVGIARP